jgi:hypothetical protein
MPNVRGTALGGKRTSGQMTGESAVVVLVDRKLPRPKLRGGSIPATLKSGTATVLTDVLEIRGLEPQFGPPPWYCYDGTSQGTVAALCVSHGAHYAVTCAHCLRGVDLDPLTTDDMHLYHPGLSDYLKVGESAYAVKARGRGVPGSYGFSDMGLFTVADEEILARCSDAVAMTCWKAPRTSTPVWAESAHGRLEGTVSLVEAQYGSVLADIVVRMETCGTFRGDSGLLWRTKPGLAVAMHALGTVGRSRDGSDMSFGMCAHRLEDGLQAVLLDLT